MKKTKEESEATAMDKKSVVVLFQSVSNCFNFSRLYLNASDGKPSFGFIFDFREAEPRFSRK